MRLSIGIFPVLTESPRGARTCGRWVRLLVCLPALALLLATGSARAEDPAAALKRTVEDGVRILRDPSYKPEGQRAAQHRRLCDVVYRDFDFAEFSKRVLADKWALFTPEQRREFTAVFSKFLADYYMDRLQERYSGEAIAYRGVDMVAPGRAVVNVDVRWRGREFPVEVRMLLRGGQWRAYDVSLLGVSAVGIYRAQFQEILRTHSPAQTIELVRSRLDQP